MISTDPFITRRHWLLSRFSFPPTLIYAINDWAVINIIWSKIIMYGSLLGFLKPYLSVWFVRAHQQSGLPCFAEHNLWVSQPSNIKCFTLNQDGNTGRATTKTLKRSVMGTLMDYQNRGLQDQSQRWHQNCNYMYWAVKKSCKDFCKRCCRWSVIQLVGEK